MWVVADLDDDYIAKMEDVLEVYERPYDPQQPVICLDEKPVTLHADVRPASPAAPGREARRDNEYERCGTANVFCAVEPKAGRHFTFATPDRSGFEFAQVAVSLAMAYPEAKTIHLVMDNLNIHRRKSLADVFGAGNGRRSLGSFHRPLHAHSRKSYKRECQETFFSARLRRRMLSCIQPPTSSNSYALWLIVLDLAPYQRDPGFRFLAFSCL